MLYTEKIINNRLSAVKKRSLLGTSGAKELFLESFENYKDILRTQVERNRHVKGYQTLLALSANCHPSFITQVLKQKVNLTPDHAAGIAQFWNLSKQDTELFLLMVYHARASSEIYRTAVDNRIKEIREIKRNLANLFKSPKIESTQIEQRYYSAWYYSAIHVLLSVPQFQDIKSLSAHLELSQAFVEKILEELEQDGIVSRLKNKWVVEKKNIHLPKSSPRLEQHLANWRHRALVSSPLKKPENIHYTAVVGLSHHDAEKIRQLMIECLSTTRSVVEPSTEEEVICINVDVYSV